MIIPSPYISICLSKLRVSSPVFPQIQHLPLIPPGNTTIRKSSELHWDLVIAPPCKACISVTPAWVPCKRLLETHGCRIQSSAIAEPHRRDTPVGLRQCSNLLVNFLGRESWRDRGISMGEGGRQGAAEGPPCASCTSPLVIKGV